MLFGVGGDGYLLAARRPYGIVGCLGGVGFFQGFAHDALVVMVPQCTYGQHETFPSSYKRLSLWFLSLVQCICWAVRFLVGGWACRAKVQSASAFCCGWIGWAVALLPNQPAVNTLATVVGFATNLMGNQPGSDFVVFLLRTWPSALEQGLCSSYLLVRVIEELQGLAGRLLVRLVQGSSPVGLGLEKC